MRLAIIHDWLVGMRGGEKCLEEILRLYPESEVFTLFHRPEELSELLKSSRVSSSLLNRLPGSRRYYRHMLPLFPVGAWDLSRKIRNSHTVLPFDAVVSISHCAAKNVLPPAGVPHICYCLTPVRYFWDQYDRYFADHPLERLIRLVVAPLRKWDVRGSRGVTRFIAISRFVRDRIRRYYAVDADVVYPPVRTDELLVWDGESPSKGFLCVNALVPYKNTKLIVEAFNHLGLPLTIVGTGPEQRRLMALAKPNIKFRGRVESDELARLYRDSEALIFAAEEDFGITPVEMLASGRPVIAYGRGGVTETVTGAGEKQNGIFFQELTVESLVEAVLAFRKGSTKFTLRDSTDAASDFSVKTFREQFQELVDLTVRGATPDREERGNSASNSDVGPADTRKRATC